MGARHVTSFPGVVDRSSHGLLFSTTWGKVPMVRKCGLLSKDFKTLGPWCRESWW